MVKAQRNYSLEAVRQVLNEIEAELRVEPDEKLGFHKDPAL
jgi:hypothetical protein